MLASAVLLDGIEGAALPLIQPDSVNASATSGSAGGSVHGTTVSEEEYEAVEAVDMEAAPVEEAAAPEPLGAAGL